MRNGAGWLGGIFGEQRWLIAKAIKTGAFPHRQHAPSTHRTGPAPVPTQTSPTPVYEYSPWCELYSLPAGNGEEATKGNSSGGFCVVLGDHDGMATRLELKPRCEQTQPFDLIKFKDQGCSKQSFYCPIFTVFLSLRNLPAETRFPCCLLGTTPGCGLLGKLKMLWPGSAFRWETGQGKGGCERFMLQ